MYVYYTASYQGPGSAEPEHAREVEQARRNQQVRATPRPLRRTCLSPSLIDTLLLTPIVKVIVTMDPDHRCKVNASVARIRAEECDELLTFVRLKLGEQCCM